MKPKEKKLVLASKKIIQKNIPKRIIQLVL